MPVATTISATTTETDDDLLARLRVQAADRTAAPPLAAGQDVTFDPPAGVPLLRPLGVVLSVSPPLMTALPWTVQILCFHANGFEMVCQLSAGEVHPRPAAPPA